MSYVMKKYLSIKGVLITTNIPEKAYITSGTFHHSDTSVNLTLCYPDFGCHVTSRNLPMICTSCLLKGISGMRFSMQI